MSNVVATLNPGTPPTVLVGLPCGEYVFTNVGSVPADVSIAGPAGAPVAHLVIGPGASSSAMLGTSGPGPTYAPGSAFYAHRPVLRARSNLLAERNAAKVLAAGGGGSVALAVPRSIPADPVPTGYVSAPSLSLSASGAPVQVSTP